MLKRTTSYQFQPYGDIYYYYPEGFPDNTTLSKTVLTLENKSFDSVYVSDEPVFLNCTSGIILLAVSKNGDRFEDFVIHRKVKLQPGVRFNVISISENSGLDLFCDASATHFETLAKPYVFTPMISRVHVEEILSAFYQVRKGGYVFPGEKHPYYELVYIDNGQLETTVEGVDYTLKKYDMMIYYPEQFHTQSTLDDQTCSYLTIIFRMDDLISEEMKNRIYKTRKDIYQVLCRFMKAVQTEDYLNHELAILYLKEIIVLLHQFDHKEEEKAGLNPLQQHYESTLLNEILVFIKNNVYTAFTVEDLCTKFCISRSSLQNLFRNNLDISPKQYISLTKLNQAKILIQQHSRTITEISDMLGFASIHYFSRKFKAQFGMSPTDYSKSIQYH